MWDGVATGKPKRETETAHSLRGTAQILSPSVPLMRPTKLGVGEFFIHIFGNQRNGPRDTLLSQRTSIHCELIIFIFLFNLYIFLTQVKLAVSVSTWVICFCDETSCSEMLSWCYPFKVLECLANGSFLQKVKHPVEGWCGLLSVSKLPLSEATLRPV
jgi:hypothetical protein